MGYAGNSSEEDLLMSETLVKTIELKLNERLVPFAVWGAKREDCIRVRTVQRTG
jgi:hypothetical protein